MLTMLTISYTGYTHLSGPKAEKVLTIRRWLQSFASSFFSELQAHHMTSLKTILQKDLSVSTTLDDIVVTIDNKVEVNRRTIREFGKEEFRLSRTCMEVILEMFRQRYTFLPHTIIVYTVTIVTLLMELL